MKRRSFLFGMLSVAAMKWSGGDSEARVQAPAGRSPVSAYEASRRAAIAMNGLAGRIETLDDARRLVDAVAGEFKESLPPKWVTKPFRERIALAEYDAATDPSRLIPEERVAGVWNKYAREIGAPDESIATQAEIHNLRDAFCAYAQVFWDRGIQSVWTMPNIYALGPEGKVAGGCRALEAVRILYDLGNTPGTLRGARERLLKGLVVSDQVAKARSETNGSRQAKVKSYAMVGTVEENPIKRAESRYLQERGEAQMDWLMLGLFDELFPA